MEEEKRVKISEVVELKIKNCNLSLQILQMQANQIMAERDRALLGEFSRLEFNPGEWQLDEKTWELKSRP